MTATTTGTGLELVVAAVCGQWLSTSAQMIFVHFTLAGIRLSSSGLELIPFIVTCYVVDGASGYNHRPLPQSFTTSETELLDSFERKAL